MNSAIEAQMNIIILLKYGKWLVIFILPILVVAFCSIFLFSILYILKWVGILMGANNLIITIFQSTENVIGGNFF